MRAYLRKKINKIKIFYLLILGITFAVFLILAFLNIQLKRQNSLLEIYKRPFDFNSQRYPQVQKPYGVAISAQGAVILDRDSQTILFEKNPNLRFSPASTTKIMTAIVALENFKPEDILTIRQAKIEGSLIEFEEGDQLTFEDLLYAMMLPSSNDAPAPIALNYPAGVEA